MTDTDLQKGLLQVITQLNAAITNTGFYSPSHPQVGKFLNAAYEGLMHLLEIRTDITMFLVGDDVVADNRSLPSDGPHVTKFVGVLKKKAIERMTFARGLPKEELQELIQDLASADSVSVHSSPHIRLGKVEIRVDASETPGDDVETEEGLRVAEELLALVNTIGVELDDVRTLCLKVKQWRKSDACSIEDVVEEFLKGFSRDVHLVNLLTTMKSSQEYTFRHAVNVGMLTMTQAETIGFAGEHLHQIGVAALLHDIGRLLLPDEIVSKLGRHLQHLSAALMLRDVGKVFIPGEMADVMRKLTKKECVVIQRHTVNGALHLMGLDGIPKLAVLAALEHHVKYDGTGYPLIKAGWKPSLVSQMIAISDVFDAMPSNGSGKESKPLDKIAWVLKKGRGTSFNPELVDHFLTLME